MGPINFEWDPRKATENRRKHRVSSEEAVTAFRDDDAILIDDPDHSHDEARFILLGFSGRARLLVVIHCLRRRGRSIRLISARRASRAEAHDYRRRWVK